MPYINKDQRERALMFPRTPGELNFSITCIGVDYIAGDYNLSEFSTELIQTVDDYMEDKPRSYDTFNSVMGVLECAPRELERRLNSEHQFSVFLLKKEIAAYQDLFYAMTMGPYEDGKCEANGDVYPENITEEIL